MKRIYHVLQMLEWSTQIAKFDRVMNRAACNDRYWTLNRWIVESQETLSDPKKAWDEFFKVWKPIFDQAEAAFEKAASIYLDFESEWERKTNPGQQGRGETLSDILPLKGFCVVDFVQTFGIKVRFSFFRRCFFFPSSSLADFFFWVFVLQSLHKYLSVKVTPSTTYPNLFHLQFSRMYAPGDSRVSHECNSLLLQQLKEKNFVVRAAPMMRFRGAYIDFSFAAENLDGLIFHEWIDGRMCCLYSDESTDA